MINSSFLKRVLTFFAACVLSTTLTFADYNSQGGYPERCDPCYNPCKTCDPCDPCPEPCCEPCDPCGMTCGGFEVGVDFIFWQPCFNDLSYAILFDTNPNASGSVTAHGKYQYLDHCFDPGFRVYAKKLDAWCGWDVSGSYTFYWSKASHSVSRVSPQELYSTLDHGGFDLTAQSITSIEASHNVRYQSFDALFHYELNCCGPCHSLTPFWGIEGVKLEQDIFSTATGESSEQSATYNVNWDSELLGLGMKLGTDYYYKLMCGLSWFTRASVTVLAGRNESTNTQIRTVQPTPVITNIPFKTCDDVCVPGFHLMAGLSYEKEWCGKTLKARIGYEFLDWWNVPQIRRFTDGGNDIAISTSGPNGSNLGLHGLFVGLELGY